MGFNTSPFAFNDAQEILERALNSPRGIKIPCKSRAQAVVLRARINYWRKQNRRENKEIYDSAHQLYGHSIYDKLVLRLPVVGAEDEHVLYIQPRTAEDLTIEEI